MGDNPEITEEADLAPPPPGLNKVEITVAGHTVLIESGDPLEDVVGYALGVYEQTRLEAKRIPLGFDVGVAQVERAPAYVDPRQEQWEDDDARRLDRQQRHAAQDGTTRRLGVPDSPGGHRARLTPMPVDREQRPLS